MLKLGERGLMAFRGEPRGRGRSAPSSSSTASPIMWSMRSAPAMRCSPTPRSRMYLDRQRRRRGRAGLALAAAVACEHDGNVPVEPNDVLDKIDRLERQAQYR